MPLPSAGPRAGVLLGCVLARAHGAILDIFEQINMHRECLPFKWSTHSSYGDRFLLRFSRLQFWTKFAVTEKHWGIELCACCCSIKVKIMFLSNPSSSIPDCLSALFQICHVHEIQVILSWKISLVTLLMYVKLFRVTASVILVIFLFCHFWGLCVMYLFSTENVQ